MLLAFVTIVLLAAYVALLVIYSYQWQLVPDFETDKFPDDVFVSVIIAARNEEQHLPLLLQDLLNQEYPDHLFELIVVNDYSSDGTSAVVKKFHPAAKLLLPSVAAEHSSKKAAIATGVAAAQGELLLVTDADCRLPSSWISTIVSFYSRKSAVFIAAPVKYVGSNSLLNIFQKLDFLTLQGITAAGVHSHFHYMCNGANLAYTKEAFEAVGGFGSIDHIASGDDMLLMQKIARKNADRIYYLKSKKAIVSTEPPASWKDFLSQRKRWASKSTAYYDYRIIAVLALVLLLNIFFFIILIAAFFDPVFWWLLLAYLLTKSTIELIFLFPVCRFYGEEKLLPYLLLFQPLHIFYTSFVGLISQFGKYAWKGRRLR